ncbi:MAG: hypothetical protein ACK4E0_18305 [Chitinophagaceae bacterium]
MSDDLFQLPTIRLRPYRSLYFAVLIVKIVLAAACYYLIAERAWLLPGLAGSRINTNPALIAMLLLSVAVTAYTQKLLIELRAIEDFDQQAKRHERVFRIRVIWYLVSAIVSLFLGAFTGRLFFFYFAAIEVLTFIPYFPSPRIFKREFNRDDIVFLN